MGSALLIPITAAYNTASGVGGGKGIPFFILVSSCVFSKPFYNGLASLAIWASSIRALAIGLRFFSIILAGGSIYFFIGLILVLIFYSLGTGSSAF